MPGRIIAIDGPAASGKSSVAHAVAVALGYMFVSSGHFYRALAWGVVRDRIPGESFQEWIQCHHLYAEEEGLEIRLVLDGEDVTPHLSEPEVAAMVSKLAVFPEVRDFVNALLRTQAGRHDLVIEGRDIGSVVFPETPHKFFLGASPEERARRRAKDGTVDSVVERDRLDSTRAIAPLSVPVGAVVIDTTNLTLDQVVATVLEHLSGLSG